METNQTTKKKFDLAGYGKAVCFLLLEVLAIISFSLGSSFIFFAILSAVIFLLILLVTFRQIKIDGLSSVAMFLFPLLVFGLLSVLSYFKYDPYFVMNNSPFLFLIPIGLTCFAASGYLINLTGTFKIRYALIVIYSGIALLTLINLIVTMIQFVPFYTLIYRDYYYYYNGARSPSSIGEMAYFLMNFSMVEVSLTYFDFYPMVLLTAFLPLGHIRFKDNRKLFLIYLGFGLLGLLSIVLTINKTTMLLLFGVAVLIGLIAIFDKFNIKTKPLKVAASVIGGLGVLGFVLVFFNAQSSVGYEISIPALRQLTTSNSFLNKIFNSNGFISRYNAIFDGTFASRQIDGGKVMIKLFGYPIHGSYVNNFGEMTWPLKDSSNFLIDSLFTSGFFGFIFLTVTLVFGFIHLFKYYKYSTDQKPDKVMIMGFVIISIAYAFISFDMTPFIFEKTTIPFYMNNIFFMDLFLFGYCYFNSVKPKAKEEVTNNE